jgi:hypothetical protein
MRFPTKIAIAVRDDLETWQKLNVAAFLAGAVAAHASDLVGLPYEDESGTTYLATFRLPVLIYAAEGAALTRARARAVERDLAVAVYTSDMFRTDNDEDNRAAVKAVPAEHLDLVGIAVHGPRGAVDRALNGLRLHP